MTDRIDESKLTAYALGELDADEAAKIEQALAADPALADEVAQIHLVAGMLDKELSAEPVPALTTAQHESLEHHVVTARSDRGEAPRMRNLRALVGVAVAAAVIIAPAVTVWLLGELAEPASRPSSAQRHLKVLESQARYRGSMQPTDQGRTAQPPGRATVPKLLAHEREYFGDLTIVAGGTIAGQTSESGPTYHLGGAGDIPGSHGQPKKDQLTFGAGSTLVWSGEGHRDPEDWNREAYGVIVENVYRKVAERPLSTFSIDVDTAAYANVRRFLTQGRRPPAGAVRVEELVNYFPYDYAPPGEKDPHPFAAYADVAHCPWESKHRLLRVAVKGREIDPDKRPPSNLVFLLDVSGSMGSTNKLPLVKKSMKLLVERLGENDRVAIVVYAGAAGVVLDSTSCHEKEKVLAALGKLQSGGSTHGSAGIKLAYQLATDAFIHGGVNRVILCTDGDFNVGTTSESELVRLIESKAKSNIFLSVLGFGMGNYQDDRLQQLADKGNGTHGYIDSIREAKKTFVDQLAGTLVTIAKDVKIQIEFNPAKVAGYRLIGYENRMLKKEDFNNDAKDAGEIGAGHTVTALYELVPSGVDVPGVEKVDPLKYSHPTAPAGAGAASDELLTLKLRYKAPDGDKSTLMTLPVTDNDGEIAKSSADFRFAAAVASFGMLLRDSKYAGEYSFDAVEELADGAKGDDPGGYRAEFIELVRKAKELPPK